MTLAAYLAFVGLAAVLAITPGPDSLLVLRYSVRRARHGILAATGSGIATVVWAALVGFGLAALIEQSAELYRALKIVGGLYLVFLGVQAIRHSRSPRGAGAEEAAAVTAVTDAGAPRIRSLRIRSFGIRSLRRPRGLGAGPSAFLAGLLSTMTNPKVGLFFLAVVPQFLPHDGSAFGITMLLGATVAVVGFLYLVLLAGVAARATAWLARPRVSKYIERISGGILAALGIGTAATAFEA